MSAWCSARAPARAERDRWPTEPDAPSTLDLDTRQTNNSERILQALDDRDDESGDDDDGVVPDPI